jgi:hypothetical protein
MDACPNQIRDMLPDFPGVKQILLHSASHLTRIGAEQDPLLGSVSSFHQHEGDRATIRREDGTVIVINYNNPLTATAEFTVDEVRTKGAGVMVDAARQMAEELNQQMAARMIESIEKATDEVGNVVDAGGKPFSRATYLEGLRTMDLSFDDDGRWLPPKLVFGEQLQERIEAVLAAADQDSEFLAERDRIVALKREEWRAREANRRLVD